MLNYIYLDIVYNHFTAKLDCYILIYNHSTAKLDCYIDLYYNHFTASSGRYIGL